MGREPGDRAISARGCGERVTRVEPQERGWGPASNKRDALPVHRCRCGASSAPAHPILLDTLAMVGWFGDASPAFRDRTCRGNQRQQRPGAAAHIRVSVVDILYAYDLTLIVCARRLTCPRLAGRGAQRVGLQIQDGYDRSRLARAGSPSANRAAEGADGARAS